MLEKKHRCEWAGEIPIYVNYHDTEWGVPIYDDRLLFEFLILEGAQAGLSWLTILKRRKHYRQCFDQFDVKKIIHYDATKYKQLLSDPGIIRNRLKIHSVITNAEAYLNVKEEFSSFSNYIWRFVDGKSICNQWKYQRQVPAKTQLSDVMSKDLKKRGFKFVGSTICYAFMQAVGMVNDHLTSCFRYREVK
jgi:DNA-3-methyladenine glycosylase I